MAGGQRRKCKCCRRLFRPDPHCRRRQRYCSEPPCKTASQVQVRSLAKPENRFTSGTPGTSRGSASGNRAILAMGAKPGRCVTA
jgi:hypothetical protein